MLTILVCPLPRCVLVPLPVVFVAAQEVGMKTSASYPHHRNILSVQPACMRATTAAGEQLPQKQHLWASPNSGDMAHG